MGATEQAFRDVMAEVCTPVTVVTAIESGRPHGTTVSAFGSLSLRPPLVLAALDRGSRLLAVVARTRRFGVNLLGHGQEQLALGFASKAEDKFAAVDWREDQGLPRLVRSPGWIACGLHELVPGGDHTIVVGAVEAADHREGPPLIYHGRRFGTHSGFVGELEPVER